MQYKPPNKKVKKKFLKKNLNQGAKWNKKMGGRSFVIICEVFMCSQGCSTNSVVIHPFSEGVSESAFSSKSSKYHKSQTVGARELKYLENVQPPHHVTCHMSHVTCQIFLSSFFNMLVPTLLVNNGRLWFMGNFEIWVSLKYWRLNCPYASCLFMVSNTSGTVYNVLNT